MTDVDRNIRTLIACFVLAVGVLVPLRFLEVNEMASQEVKVLGETEEVVFESEDSGDYNEEVTELDSTLEVGEIVLPEVGGEE